ncbi:MAG: hypothetical protein AABY83_14835 [Pseudomonadota bacterium]|mgnify:CR=1 FL=1
MQIIENGLNRIVRSAIYLFIAFAVGVVTIVRAEESNAMSTVRIGNLQLSLPMTMLKKVEVLNENFVNLAIASQQNNASTSKMIFLGVLAKYGDRLSIYRDKGVISPKYTVDLGVFFGHLASAGETDETRNAYKILEVDGCVPGPITKYPGVSAYAFKCLLPRPSLVYYQLDGNKDLYYAKGVFYEPDLRALTEHFAGVN